MTGAHVLTDSQVRAAAAGGTTPLYVYSRRELRQRHANLTKAIAPANLYYSVKANPNADVCAEMHSLGCEAEIASIGELDTALEAGFDAGRLLYIGPGKTDSDIRDSFAKGVRRYVVDSEHELKRLSHLTDLESVYLRVNPAFEAEGGKLTMSGARPKQFGIDRDEVAHFVRTARSHGLEVRGLHYYLGTRFLKADDIVRNSRKILDDALAISAESGIELEFLDFGGGFGIAYFENEEDLNEEVLRGGLQQVIKEAAQKLPNTELCFESGRYLTATSGTLIISIVAAKRSYGLQYLVCDGGTNINMAAIGTGSIGKRNFPHRLVARDAGHRSKPDLDAVPTNVTGPLCTPDDLLLKTIKCPVVQTPGDYIVIDKVGAYGPTASPHSFLGHRFPREIITD